MTSKAEHRSKVHQIATFRRQLDMPHWDRHIDLSGVFHNEDMDFFARRDAIADLLRSSGWLESDPDENLPAFLGDLATAADAAKFDEAWNEIYNLADYDRVWITTR